eukprot:6490645-Amphidinium_carterae.3
MDSALVNVPESEEEDEDYVEPQVHVLKYFEKLNIQGLIDCTVYKQVTVRKYTFFACNKRYNTLNTTSISTSTSTDMSEQSSNSSKFTPLLGSIGASSPVLLTKIGTRLGAVTPNRVTKDTSKAYP